MKRRDFFKQLGVVAAATSVMPVMSFAEKAEKASKPKGPNDMPYKVAVEAITGGKAVETSSKVTLKVPEIAENGAVVPVTVNVDSPMSESDYVKAIHIIAAKMETLVALMYF